MNNENWRQIEGHPNYEISDQGKIRNVKHNKLLSGFTNRGYQYFRTASGEKFAIHRLVASLFLEPDEERTVVDHIDGNKANNHFTNLRWANHAENRQNTTKCDKQTSSQFKGVYRRNMKNGTFRFEAHITYNKKKYNIGIYKTELEASQAYDIKALDLFGQFAKTNHPVANYL